MKYLYFLKYNNYANRTVKIENTISDYLGGVGSPNLIKMVEDVKLWNPNDGIMTIYTSPNNVDFSTEPDYLVTSDNGYDVDTRWFVVETVRLHRGQFECTLRRDVFAEAWNELISATCNIDRAIAARYDSIIFNPEPVTVNEIIESETEIKDKSGCPWIVFYSDSAIPANLNPVPDPQDYDLSTPLSKSAFIELWSKRYIRAGKINSYLGYKFQTSGGSVIPDTNPHYISLNPLSGVAPTTPSHTSTLAGAGNYQPQVLYKGTAEYKVKDLKILDDPLVYYYNNSIWNTDPDNPQGESDKLASSNDFIWLGSIYGKRLYSEADNKIYRITYTNVGWGDNVYIRGSLDSAYSPLYNIVCNQLINGMTNMDPYSTKFSAMDQRSITLSAIVDRIVPRLEEITEGTNITINVPTSQPTIDCPYNIWCMPYGNIDVTYYTDSEHTATITTDRELNLRSATTIIKNMTTESLYDVQILPFAPIPDEYLQDDGSILVPYGSRLTNATTMKDNSNNCKGFIFSVPYATFERQILLDSPITITDPKLDEIIRKYRLYAPNYSSAFEFSVGKNDGLTGFNVSCTYLPIQPYIRVAPIWGGLYGDQSFRYDPRGLICSGDYSLARTRSGWIEYLEQNKNYQSIFARQLQNMDVQRGIQRQEERWGMVSGVLQGAGGGAIAGAAAGPWGALAGGVVGGVGAGITGAMDMKNAEKLFQESKSYATDLHTLQLGNVQALPIGLSRTTAFNVDNRYFPIFTTYRCTENEERAVAQFILNRSMTIGRIGSPSEYLNNTWSWDDGAHNRHDRGFIQGSIIKINTIHDTHFVDVLNEEFQKGVYTK